MSQIEQHGPEDICRIIIGNKVDCPAQDREVTMEEGEELAAKYGVKYVETSAKENIGITETFEILGKEMIEKDEKHPKYPSIFTGQSQQSQPSNSGIMQTPIPPPFPQSSQPPPKQKFELNENQKKDKKKKSCC